MHKTKLPAFLISIIWIFSLLTGIHGNIKASAAFSPGSELYCKGCYMVNLELGTVVAAKNEHERCFPASLTKLMTAIVAYENCSDLSMPAEVSEVAMKEFDTDDPNIDGASTCGLVVRQTGLTMRDCLYGLLVRSGCEAGNVIAYNIGKGEGQARIDDFIGMMNVKAAAIGCRDTHFSNTHGLWAEDNYSTPYDLYLIARYIYDEMPELIEISDTYQYIMPANKDNPDPYIIGNVNGLVNRSDKNEYFYPYARGIKTGSMNEYFTKDADGNFTVWQEGFASVISTASKNGVSYMLVCSEAPYHDSEGKRLYGHYKDSLMLYEWAFGNFKIERIIDEDTIAATVNISGGETDTLPLKPKGRYSALLPKNAGADTVGKKVTITAVTDENGAVPAPVEKGQIMGTLELTLDGKILFTSDLLAAKDVGTVAPVTSLTEGNEIVDPESGNDSGNKDDNSSQTGSGTVIIVIMSIIAGVSAASVCIIVFKSGKKK